LDTLRGDERIHNSSSLELIKSEFFISLSDVLCESHEKLTSDISDIYDKTFLFEYFQESINVSFDCNDEPYGKFDILFKVDKFYYIEQPNENEEHPFLFIDQQKVFLHVFKDPLASLLESSLAPHREDAIPIGANVSTCKFSICDLA
jgi:hypothetical protein